MLQSVLRDVFEVKLPSLVRGTRQAISERARRGKDLIGSEWEALLRNGSVGNRAELARRMGVSRARVTQVLGNSAGSAG